MAGGLELEYFKVPSNLSLFIINSMILCFSTVLQQIKKTLTHKEKYSVKIQLKPVLFSMVVAKLLNIMLTFV